MVPRIPDPSRASLWLPVGAYMAMIFAISSISNPPGLPTGSDKGLHSLMYAGLAVLIVRALAAGRLRSVTVRVALVAAALATLYGFTDEVHQQFVQGRSAELLDVMANAFGACAGAAAVRLWSRMSHGV